MADANLREHDRAARDGGGSEAWTRLALERARAGLEGGAEAVRALLLDPSAPVRELIGRDGTPGLRSLGRERTIQLPMSLDSAPSGLLDLGGGRALVVATTEVSCVDLFREAVVWRGVRPDDPVAFLPARVGDRLVEVTAGRCHWRSALTGQESGRADLPHRGQSADVVAIDDRTCAIVISNDRDPRRVVWLDLDAGRIIATAAATAGRPDGLDRAIQGPVVLGGHGTVQAWEADGGLRWSTPVEHAGACRGRGDRVIVEVGSTTPHVVVLDGRDGRELLRVEGLQAIDVGDALLVERVVDGGAAIERWSMRTGQRQWSTPLSCPAGDALWPDAAGDVAVVTRTSRRGSLPGARCTLRTTGLDLAAGTVLWEREPKADEWHVQPAAGLLVVIGGVQGWFQRSAPLRVIPPAWAVSPPGATGLR